MKSVLIIGAGQFGIHIAKRMSELRCEIMAVDSDEARINKILPYVANAQIGNSTNADFMESLGIPDYDVCIVTISDSFQNSLETTALLKDLGARKVISRAQNDVQEKFLRETFGTRVLFVRAAEVDISSNHIRRLLRNGRFRAAAKLLPAPVLDYIRVRRLYADTE